VKEPGGDPIGGRVFAKEGRRPLATARHAPLSCVGLDCRHLWLLRSFRHAPPKASMGTSVLSDANLDREELPSGTIVLIGHVNAPLVFSRMNVVKFRP
jgi:hypothetical protein